MKNLLVRLNLHTYLIVIDADTEAAKVTTISTNDLNDKTKFDAINTLYFNGELDVANLYEKSFHIEPNVKYKYNKHNISNAKHTRTNSKMAVNSDTMIKVISNKCCKKLRSKFDSFINNNRNNDEYTTSRIILELTYIAIKESYKNIIPIDSVGNAIFLSLVSSNIIKPTSSDYNRDIILNNIIDIVNSLDDYSVEYDDMYGIRVIKYNKNLRRASVIISRDQAVCIKNLYNEKDLNGKRANKCIDISNYINKKFGIYVGPNAIPIIAKCSNDYYPTDDFIELIQNDDVSNMTLKEVYDKYKSLIEMDKNSFSRWLNSHGIKYKRRRHKLKPKTYSYPKLPVSETMFVNKCDEISDIKNKQDLISKYIDVISSFKLAIPVIYIFDKLKALMLSYGYTISYDEYFDIIKILENKKYKIYDNGREYVVRRIK